MKTYMKYFLAVTVIFAIGIVAAGTVTAAEEPIWRNFVNETTLSGTLPSEASLTNTAPIWQTQFDEIFHKQADHQAFPVALDESAPIWCKQVKCS